MSWAIKAAPWLGGALVAALIWGLWSRLDHATKERDAALAAVAAYQRDARARAAADTKAKERNDDFQTSRDTVGGGDDPARYLCRLRAVQTGTDPAACDAPDVQR